MSVVACDSARELARPRTAAGPGLSVEALSHRYGAVEVLHEVGFAVPPGEVHCLLGPSGSGKSTCLRLIAGLEPLQQGRVMLDGAVLALPGREVAPEARRIGLMFQDVALFPHLTVAENVAFGLAGMPTAQRRARVLELLRAVDMERHAAKRPFALSGGEQQRVALARALAPEPRLMLLDEAFSALDPALRAEVRAVALGLLRERAVPTLLVTHDVDEAVREGDRVHVLEAGRLVQSGTPDELYSHPASPFVAGFFGPVLRLRARAGQGAALTAMGPVATPAASAGEPVEVVIRHRAIQLGPAAEAPLTATIAGCRRMGDTCRVALEREGLQIAGIDVPRHMPHEIGMQVGVRLDPRHVFVFPAR